MNQQSKTIKTVKMKTLKLCFIMGLFINFNTVEAQFIEKLGKKAERAAERTVERKVERKTEQKTGEVMDEVLGDGKKNKKRKKKKSGNNRTIIGGETSNTNSRPNHQEILSGSSFFPNGNVLFHETFTNDPQGDFPARWDTNAGGEVILVNGQKALRFYPNASILPKINQSLPDNYAIEFDLITANLAYNGSAGSYFQVRLMNEQAFGNQAGYYTSFYFSLWKGSSQPDQINIENFGRGINKIKNTLKVTDIESKLNGTIKCVIVRNGSRLRFYMDGQKVIDIPSILSNGMGNYIQFSTGNLNTERNDIVAINSFKIIQEAQDSRSQLEIDLIDKGNFSTNNILFSSGSSNLNQASFSVLNEIGNVLKGNPTKTFKIIGHTDSDGSAASNLKLSMDRANAVKNYLVQNFNIPSQNLLVDGKGDTKPLVPNTNAENKAQNRRVEFILNN